jgi:hypothetical protein
MMMMMMTMMTMMIYPRDRLLRLFIFFWDVTLRISYEVTVVSEEPTIITAVGNTPN